MIKLMLEDVVPLSNESIKQEARGQKEKNE
jgi:hypothetical protein